jgi:cob(I)alamin adenosyltransferase
MPYEFAEYADLISEIREVKHYFQKGTPSRKGIEY